MTERKEKNVVTIDPELWMNRMLHYQERHSGWAIFTSIYWSIYVLLLSFLLIFYNSLNFSVASFFGVALFVFAIMAIIFGFTQSLHYKLLKRYG